MRLLLIILLLLSVLAVKSQPTSSYLYIKVGTAERVFSCGAEEVFVELTKHKMTIVSSKVTINGTVSKRKIGEYNSVIIYDSESEIHYFVTPIKYNNHYGLVFAPCDSKGNIRTDLPLVITATFELCE